MESDFIRIKGTGVLNTNGTAKNSIKMISNTINNGKSRLRQILRL